MKKFNMNGAQLTTAFIAALSLAASLPADGQQAQEPAVASVGGKSLGSLKVENDNILIRHGKGGWISAGQANIGVAVKALTELYPDITFVADPRVADKPITDFIDRSDDAMTDLKAIRAASGGAFDIRSENSSLITLLPNDVTFAPPGLGGMVAAPEDKSIACFNLSGYLGRIDARVSEKWQEKMAEKSTPEARARMQDQENDEVRIATDQAIQQLREIIRQTAADVDSSIAPPKYAFYEEAQLLVVTGQRRAIEIARTIVHALPGQHMSNDSNDSPTEIDSDRHAFLQRNKALLEALSPNGASTNKP